MNKKIQILFFLIFVGGCLLIAGCSKSNDQRDFENHAISTQPEGITRTNANGETIDEDPDDWRISPFYSGLIQVETPAYPNPVAYNSSNLRIDLYLTPNIERANRIEVYAFRLPGENNIYGPLDVLEDLSSLSSIETINLSGEHVANSSGGSQASGIYRILIYDGRSNLISYGDVEVQ
jgi:hypothetical protein